MNTTPKTGRIRRTQDEVFEEVAESVKQLMIQKYKTALTRTEKSDMINSLKAILAEEKE